MGEAGKEFEEATAGQKMRIPQFLRNRDLDSVFSPISNCLNERMTGDEARKGDNLVVNRSARRY